ncbi:PREDICTED: uncharacterized protein LOC105453737 [Wasmannia auropunctata]|uniref:uncharacterized protein LOC105453737 n=1 Tax=Wasmannia auropunctata TaxID=64793 RepID=UPI0005EF08CC|nr:PREDICTED: uncharacterized protein LOC105453737 [Wasmannia auropunctata]
MCRAFSKCVAAYIFPGKKSELRIETQQLADPDVTFPVPSISSTICSVICSNVELREQPRCQVLLRLLSVGTRPRCALATGALLAASGAQGDDAPLTGLRRLCAPIRIGNWSNSPAGTKQLRGSRPKKKIGISVNMARCIRTLYRLLCSLSVPSV